jgi:flagellar biosynthesis/type III secretory pathway chaperone
MSKCLQELVSVLNGKHNELDELLTLTEHEQRCIIEIDINGLESIDNRKLELLNTMQRTSAECRLLLKKVSEELNVEPAETITPLLPKVPQPVRDTLKQLQEKLLQQGVTLNRNLEFNRELLEGSLNHVRQSMDFLNSFFTRSSTYGQGGSMMRTPNEVRVVCKEV